jgi:DNA-binding MarR family transcriptional regulator
MTHRTMRVLGAVAARPGLNNAAASEGAGVTDQGQISKLLRRLERRGLVENRGGGQTEGSGNAWHLTPLGESIEREIGPIWT